MLRHAFILGGTDQIGLAITKNLIDADWHVTVAHSGSRALPSKLIERGVKVVTLDREKPSALACALSSGADALIDITAYGPEHARQLLEVQHNVGKLVVISSSSVYRDD